MTIPAEKCPEYDVFFVGSLGAIRACADLALTQGPLSRRNALQEIKAMAEQVLTPLPDKSRSTPQPHEREDWDPLRGRYG